MWRYFYYKLQTINGLHVKGSKTFLGNLSAFSCQVNIINSYVVVKLPDHPTKPLRTNIGEIMVSLNLVFLSETIQKLNSNSGPRLKSSFLTCCLDSLGKSGVFWLRADCLQTDSKVGKCLRHSN